MLNGRSQEWVKLLLSAHHTIQIAPPLPCGLVWSSHLSRRYYACSGASTKGQDLASFHLLVFLQKYNYSPGSNKVI